MKTPKFEEIKAKGETMSAEDRIAYLENQLDWALGFLEVETEDRKKAQDETKKYQQKLNNLKSALQDLL